jgi:signal transduction histidine kinase
MASKLYLGSPADSIPNSEREQFEQTLQEKNIELKDAQMAEVRFLARMSHELHTPLNAIIGFTGTLLTRLPGPLNDEQTRQLQIIQSSARHLLSLINDLLDLAEDPIRPSPPGQLILSGVLRKLVERACSTCVLAKKKLLSSTSRFWTATVSLRRTGTPLG